MQTKQDILDFCDSFSLPLKEDIQTLWDLGFKYTRASSLSQIIGAYYVNARLPLDNSEDSFVEVIISTKQCKPDSYGARIIIDNRTKASFVAPTLDDLLKEISKN